MNLTETSIMISTNEFSFTNAEIGFIKKTFQRKYPAVMGDFIEHVRMLMKSLQTASKGTLVYNAHRYFPEGSSRYHISETLSSTSADGQKIRVSIYPIDPDRKLIFNTYNKSESIGVNNKAFLNKIEDCVIGNGLDILSSSTHNGVPMRLIFNEVLELLKKIDDQMIVQNSVITIGRYSRLNAEISHKLSRSHYLQLHFDFSTLRETSVK